MELECNLIMESSIIKKNAFFFVALVYLFVLQDFLQLFISPLKYLDELFAILLIPLFFWNLIRNEFKATFTLRQIAYIILLSLYVIAGLCGTMINQYQPITNAISDIYVNIKFFLAIGVSELLFGNCDQEYTYLYSWKWLNIITYCLFTLCIMDLVFHIFPGTSRMGIRSVKLFYSTYSILAAQGSFLCAIYFRLYEYAGERIFPRLLMLWFVILCTLRMKAVGAVIIMFFIYFIVCRKNRKIKFLTWGVIGAGLIMMAARQFLYYFVEFRNSSARYMLTYTALQIGKDYFPFGTGWGTFGSAFSVEPYSPVYLKYHLAQVWGLSESHPSFISDSFWPMVLAQTGWIGIVIYVVMLFILGTAIWRMWRKNAYAYASALTSLIYLLISSTSESAFVNSFAVPFAFWIGFLFLENKKQERYLLK